MQVRLIPQREVAELLDRNELLEALADGFRSLSSGAVQAPPRSQVVVPDSGLMLAMPAHAVDQPLGIKLVTVFHENEDHGLPSHLALITLMDPKTGATQAILDGTHITALRTAGAATLAAKLLARPESRVLTILGAGVQGRWHLELMAAAFDLERIFIGSLHRRNAEQLAARHTRAEVTEDYEAAIRQSDLVCLCSHSSEPLIQLDWVRPGQHVSSIGYAPPGGELDPALAAAHRVFVETRMAFQPPPAGCSELAGLDPESGTELGEVLLGTKSGRTSPDEVTVYKAMGHAIEDLVVANLVYRNAVAQDRGQLVEL